MLEEGIPAFMSISGVLPLKPDQKVEDITDIKILDGLIRAHVLVAEIIGRGSRYYVDYLLMAHAYLMRLWQVKNIYVQMYTFIFSTQ